MKKLTMDIHKFIFFLLPATTDNRGTNGGLTPPPAGLRLCSVVESGPIMKRQIT
jgi:hypothetical protein